jgi:hypothetical protein
VVEIYQVGRLRPNGWIVRREVEALADLSSEGATPIKAEFSMAVNAKVFFHNLE